MKLYKINFQDIKPHPLVYHTHFKLSLTLALLDFQEIHACDIAMLYLCDYSFTVSNSMLEAELGGNISYVTSCIQDFVLAANSRQH